jgi:predicted outer membrane repeat protein
MKTVRRTTWVLLVCGLVGAANVSAGLVHEYQLNGDGNDSVGGADAVVGPIVTFTAAEAPVCLGQAALFGPGILGADDELTASGVTDFGAGDFSIAFWLRRDFNDSGNSDGVFDALAGVGEGWLLIILSDHTLRFRMDSATTDQGYNSTAGISDSNWHHVVLSVDRDSTIGLRWYIDATFDSSHDPTIVSGAIIANKDLTIGDFNSGNGLDGALAQAQFYDHALTAEEVTALYTPQINDADNDSVPDACDLCTGNDASGDTDTDGVCNDLDACPGFDDTLDGDGDGIPNGCDTQVVHNITQATHFYGLQDAIDASAPDDLIEADPQTYFEAINFNGKAITLRSASGDPNDTIIDGAGHFHAVQCVSGEEPNTLLKGLTITGGIADGPGLDRAGGGMLNSNNSSPTVHNCRFHGNQADLGGGMFNETGCSPTITQCRFTDNSAGLDGGGMYISFGSSPLIHCSFSENSATRNGGGIHIEGSGPLITDGSFINNTAHNGAGMAIASGGNPMIARCRFAGNSATNLGGGLVGLSSTVTTMSCNFTGNSAALFGGGFASISGTDTVTNCSFTGNTARLSGFDNGGGMYVDESGSTTVFNSIFWNNTPDEVIGGSVYYSDVQGSISGPTIDGGGNIHADPLFVDADGADDNFGTDDDDLRLQTGSPCIDAGDALSIITAVLLLGDADNDVRAVDDPLTVDTGVGFDVIIDMGAYEFQAIPLCHSNLQADINCDGMVDLLDQALLALHWLETI